MKMSSNIFPTNADAWCRTKANEEINFSFAWTIENFSQRNEERDESISSSEFTIRGSDGLETRWYLILFPKGEKESEVAPGYDGILPSADVESLAVYLELVSTDDPVQAKFILSILDKDNIKQNQASLSKFTLFDIDSANDNRGFSKFIGVESLTSHSSQLLPQDNLTIVCDITIQSPIDTVVTESKHKEANRQKENMFQLSQDLEKALAKKELSDIKIYCGDRVFDCHQVILSSRSPVFEAMFQADMTEKKTRKVQIDDFHPNVIEEVLNFIYTGCVKTPKLLDENAPNILSAAEKYQLDQLKDLCEEKLCKNLDKNNCVKLLVFGDMFRASKLKKASLKFIANASLLKNSNNWKECLQDRPHLLIEVIEAMAKRGFGEIGSFS